MASHLLGTHNIKCKESEPVTNKESQNSGRTKLCDNEQKKRNKVLLDFIIDSFESFAVVDKKKFIEFCYVMDPRYVVPERHTVAELVKSNFYELYNKCKITLKGLNSKVIFHYVFLISIY